MTEPTDFSPQKGGAGARRLAATCARIADELKGENIVVLDMAPLLEITDFFVLVTGNNRRQIRAIGEEIIVRMKAHGIQRTNMDGMDAGVWVLTDFGGVVIHIFNEEAREFYDLDGLWADAERIDWTATPGLSDADSVSEEAPKQRPDGDAEQAAPAESE